MLPTDHGTPTGTDQYRSIEARRAESAFEEPRWRRLAQVCCAVVYCLFAAGIVFGYAALKPVLLEEGVYRNHCTADELDRGVPVCYDQELRLNLMFTVAAVCTNVVALPVGTILDRFGPRVSGIAGSGFISLGCLLLAFASKLPFDGYVLGYLLLAVGGPFVFISSFHLSNAFPRHSGLVLALLTGAFDASSAIFLFYRLVYQATGTAVRPMNFFSAYLVVPVFIFAAQTTLMPAASYKTVGELATQAEDAADADGSVEDENADEELGMDEASTTGRLREARRVRRASLIGEATELLGGRNAAPRARKEDEKPSIRGVWGALHGQTASQQIRSPWFVLITLFTVVQMTRINYFVATVRSQYEFLLGDYSKAVRINNFFDVALPLGGVIAVPVIGLILDNMSTPFCLGLLVVVATAIGALGVVPTQWAAYANIGLFVVYRPLYYTAISDYAAKVFGFSTFGKVYGLIICLAGLLNFAQAGLDALTQRAFARNPVPVNLLLLSLALLVGIALVAYVGSQSGRTVAKEPVGSEADPARSASVDEENAPERFRSADRYGSGYNTLDGGGGEGQFR